MTTSRRTVVGDASTRALLGVAGVGLAAVAIRRDRVGPREEAVFRAVNHLPDGLFAPGWVVMQCGSLAAAPVAASVAWACGRHRLATRLLVSGTSTWLVAKLVKHPFGRPRPRALIPDTCCRGRDATGLGFVSGHAGVAVALALASAPELGPRARTAVAVTAPVVGLCRIYVGAHLPLDVVGGAATGMAVEAVTAGLMETRTRCRRAR